MSTVSDTSLPPLGRGASPAQLWQSARHQATRQRTYYSVFNLGALLLAHAVLALAMDNFRWLATLHSLATLAVGLRFATSRKTYDLAIYTCAYIATSDVLWRMTRAVVFWEFGKYSIILLLGILLLNQRGRLGLTPWAILYFLLLLPSVALTIGARGLTSSLRKVLSFNLSGPLTLALVVIFFSGYAGKRFNISKVLVWALMPISGIFTIALYSTLTASRLSFGNAANFVTSGGFGPNQVSVVLGLGIIFSLILAVQAPNHLLRLAYMGIAAGFGFQGILTFSRGGMFGAAIALGAFGFHTLQNRRIRQSFLAVMAVAALVSVFVLLPRLTAWTSGKVAERFTSLDTTGRQTLAEADLQLFFENPVLGVGPGQSSSRRRAGALTRAAAHTEFTRLLAEHGIFGVAAILSLGLIALQAYRLAPNALARGWVACMASWSLASMTHAGMRVAAMSFVFGLAVLPFYYWRQQDRAAQASQQS